MRGVGICDGDGVTESPAQTLAAFERHLRSERGRSEHTTRAYLGDLRGLLKFLQDECGTTDLADVGLRELRACCALLSKGLLEQDDAADRNHDALPVAGVFVGALPIVLFAMAARALDRELRRGRSKANRSGACVRAAARLERKG